MKEMKYCTKCIPPQTHEAIQFDEKECAMFAVSLK